MIMCGDYVDDESTNPGSIFKFEDVNTLDLGIEDLYLPGYMQQGQNVHVVLTIEGYDEDLLIWNADPVEVKER